MSKKTRFSEAVEAYVRENECSYIAACLEVADQLEIDEDDIKDRISESLKQKIELEAIRDKTVKSNTSGTVDALADFL